MVNISKRPVNKENLRKTFRLLHQILKKARNEEEFERLTVDLLSPAEQIMKKIPSAFLSLSTTSKAISMDFVSPDHLEKNRLVTIMFCVVSW